MTIETIKLSQLSKKYIDNHDVMCNGVHCKYQKTIGLMGEVKKEYVVLNSLLDIRFTKLSELKDYIKNYVEVEVSEEVKEEAQEECKDMTSDTGLYLDYHSAIGDVVFHTYQCKNHARVYVNGKLKAKLSDLDACEIRITKLKKEYEN